MSTKIFSPQHQAARDYAEAGVPVFPLAPDTKVPWTEHGFKDETTDLAQIDAWWAAEPNLNVAYRPLHESLSVVDLDGPLGLENWEKLKAEHGGAPDTYTVRTPSGGVHLYYEGDLPPSVSKLAEKVDTRGGGSYVLIPPSVVNGKPYVALDPRDPVPLPAWVPVALAAAKRHKAADAPAEIELDTPDALARARDFLKRQPPAIQGQNGDTQTFITAATLADLGVSEETALELMLELYNPHCEPEWELEELEVKVSSAYRNRENAVGAFANPRPSSEAFASYASEPTGEPTGGDTRFRAYTLAEMRSRPPLKWLLPGFVTERGLGLIYGPAGGYKTFMAIMRACEIAATGRPVVWIAGEGSVDVAPRIDAWRLLHNSPELPITIFEDMPLAVNDGDLHQFVREAKVQGVEADAILVDTAATMMLGLNESDAKDAGIFINGMKSLRNGFDAAVIAIHHTGKDVGKGTRGSSAIPAGVDHSFEVEADTRARSVQWWTRRHRSAPIPSAPEQFQGKELAGTLVFQTLTPEGYKELMGDPNIMSPEKVRDALRELNARNGNVVVSRTLSTKLRPQRDDESPDEYQLALGRIDRALGKASKGDLQLLSTWDQRHHTQAWTLPG